MAEKSDGVKLALGMVAEACEKQASEHSEHGCIVKGVASAVGSAARAAAEKYGEAVAGVSRGGPAQVATARYRDNYETIFGKKQTVGQA